MRRHLQRRTESRGEARHVATAARHSHAFGRELRRHLVHRDHLHAGAFQHARVTCQSKAQQHSCCVTKSETPSDAVIATSHRHGAGRRDLRQLRSHGADAAHAGTHVLLTVPEVKRDAVDDDDSDLRLSQCQTITTAITWLVRNRTLTRDKTGTPEGSRPETTAACARWPAAPRDHTRGTRRCCPVRCPPSWPPPRAPAPRV